MSDDPIVDGAVIDGPLPDESKAALAAHVEEPEAAAADLPTDVKDGEAGDGT